MWLQKLTRNNLNAQESLGFEHFVFDHDWPLPPFELSPANGSGAKFYRVRCITKQREFDEIASSNFISVSHFGYNPSDANKDNLLAEKKIDRCNWGDISTFYLSDLKEASINEVLKNHKKEELLASKIFISEWEVVEPIKVCLCCKYDYSSLNKSISKTWESLELGIGKNFGLLVEMNDIIAELFTRKESQNYFFTSIFCKYFIENKGFNGISYMPVDFEDYKLPNKALMNIALYPSQIDNIYKKIEPKEARILRVSSDVQRKLDLLQRSNRVQGEGIDSCFVF